MGADRSGELARTGIYRVIRLYVFVALEIGSRRLVHFHEGVIAEITEPTQS